jgi:hypothetical protein
VENCTRSNPTFKNVLGQITKCTRSNNIYVYIKKSYGILYICLRIGEYKYNDYNNCNNIIEDLVF